MSSSTKQQQLLLQRKGKAVAEKGTPAAAEKVVVAVRAAIREISKTAIVWALTHVVQPGGSIILLVVIPAQSSGMLFLSLQYHASSATANAVLLIFRFFELRGSHPRFHSK